MEYIIFYLLLVILFLENPWRKIKVSHAIRKWSERIILFLGIIHGLSMWSGNKESYLALISGIFLYGLIFTFFGAKEHKGIEDKVARNRFKRLTWFLLFIFIFIHILK